MSRRRRRWLLAGLVVASLVAATGLGAFSDVSADRSVEVAVVEDESAYLALAPDGALECGDETVIVENRFPTQLDSVTVAVEARGSGDARIAVGKPDETLSDLGPGESTELQYDKVGAGASLSLRVDHDWNRTEHPPADELRIRVVEATGDDVSVSEPERRVEVDC